MAADLGLNPYLSASFEKRPVTSLETPAVIVDLPVMRANAEKVVDSRVASMTIS